MGLLFWITITRDVRDERKWPVVNINEHRTVTILCYSFRCISILLMTASFAQGLTPLIISVTFYLLGLAACD
jgi:hypothetical protein